MKTIPQHSSTPDPIAEAQKDKNFEKYAQGAATRIRLACIIYEARTRKQITQTQLAKLVGTTQKIISLIENGDSNIGIELLSRLVKSMDLGADELSRIFNSKVTLLITSLRSESGSAQYNNQREAYIATYQ